MPGVDQFVPITITTTSVEEEQGRAVLHLVGDDGELWPPASLNRDRVERLSHQLAQFLEEHPAQRQDGRGGA